MLNIIIPLAAGKFDTDNEDFLYPLPLIDIRGKALIEYLLENLNGIAQDKKFIFILKETDCKKYHLDNMLNQLVDDAFIVRLKNQTKGAICSVLYSIDEIDKNEELLIVNSDQIIDIDYNKALKELKSFDGGLITFNSVHPRWSFVRISEDKVVETAEKNPISNKAIAGFYYFKRAIDFIEGAFNVIRFDDNFNGNYYTSSVYNQLILKGKEIGFYHIDSNLYHSFYSPQKLKEFEEYLKLNHH